MRSTAAAVSTSTCAPDDAGHRVANRRSPACHRPRRWQLRHALSRQLRHGPSRKPRHGLSSAYRRGTHGAAVRPPPTRSDPTLALPSPAPRRPAPSLTSQPSAPAKTVVPFLLVMDSFAASPGTPVAQADEPVTRLEVPALATRPIPPLTVACSDTPPSPGSTPAPITFLPPIKSSRPQAAVPSSANDTPASMAPHARPPDTGDPPPPSARSTHLFEPPELLSNTRPVSPQKAGATTTVQRRCDRAPKESSWMASPRSPLIDNRSPIRSNQAPPQAATAAGPPLHRPHQTAAPRAHPGVIPLPPSCRNIAHPPDRPR